MKIGIFNEPNPNADKNHAVKMLSFDDRNGSGEAICPFCNDTLIGEGWSWKCTNNHELIGPHL